MSIKKITFIIFVFILAVGFSGCSQKQSEQLENNKEKESKIQTQTENNTKNQTEKIATTSEVASSEWQKYENQQLDITFDYPPTWKPQEISNWGENDLRFSFKTVDSTGIKLHVVGVNDNYVDEGPGGWFGYCAVQYKDVNDFCADGCELINDNLAIDYRYVYHGDHGFSAIAYLNLSKKFPSICMELDIGQVLSEIGNKESINYSEVAKQYDVKSMIENKEVSDTILKEIDNFKRLISSIEMKN